MHSTLSLPAVAAAALITLGACQTTKPSPDGTKPNGNGTNVGVKLGAKPALSRPALFQPGDTMPDVMGVAGIKSLTALGTLASDIMATAGSDTQLDVESNLLEAIASAYGLSDTSWIDLNAPIYTVLANQVTHANGYAVAVPLRELGPALESLPKTPGFDVGNHMTGYRNNGRDVYVDVAGHHLVFSNHIAMFPTHDALFKRLVTWAPQGEGTLYLLPQTFNRAYQKEIKEALREIPKLMAMSGESSLVDVQAFIDLGMKFFRESALWRMSLVRRTVGTAKHVAIDYGIAPVADSGLSKLVTMMKGATLPWPAMMPPKAWLGGLTNLDWRGVDALKAFNAANDKLLADALGKLKGDKAAAQFTALATELFQSTTGKSMFGMYADGAFPFGVVGLLETTKDAASMRKLFNGYVELATPALAQDALKEMPGVSKVSPKKLTIKKLVSMAAKELKKGGLKVTTKGVGKGTTTYDLLTISTAKRPKSDPGAWESLKTIGGKLEIAVVYGDKRMAIGLGPDGLGAATALAEGKGMGGMSATRALGAKGSMRTAFHLGELAEALKKHPDIGPTMGALPPLPQDDVMLFGIVSDGDEAVMSMSVPESYVGLVGGLFMMFGG